MHVCVAGSLPSRRRRTCYLFSQACAQAAGSTQVFLAIICLRNRPKRGALALLKQAKKQKLQEQSEPSTSSAPTSFAPFGQPMSQLEMISEAPVACSVIKALRHKNANISFISEVCKSAGLEGSKKQATLSLFTVQTERTFHSRLRRDLPVVSTKEVSLKIGQRICKRRVSF